VDSALTPPEPLASGGLRVTALGGINEIGRNMTVFEHLGRLLIVDCGVLFPTHDEPGVDLILPDLRHIEHRLDEIEAQVPIVAGRIDREKIAAVGHSMGGQTVGMILGAGLIDPDGVAPPVTLRDARYKAGVLLAAPGNGGDSLSEFARENYAALNPDFSTMTTPTLVVVGDEDDNPHLTTRGAEWHTDPYTNGPGAQAMLTLFGGRHGLGGIAGYDAKETDDEDPERLATTQRMVCAWLRSVLYPGDPAWSEARMALAQNAESLGRVDEK